MRTIIEMSELEYREIQNEIRVLTQAVRSYKDFLQSELNSSERLIEDAYQKMKRGSYPKDAYDKLYTTQKFRQRILEERLRSLRPLEKTTKIT